MLCGGRTVAILYLRVIKNLPYTSAEEFKFSTHIFSETTIEVPTVKKNFKN
jgi:hypothetical protein